ncbi:MAG TPA: ABC transporter substrate-binding protein [Acetobacteraceae bacterium]|nr:ABC transporter substrate-binding protein [Acetobacteraceae bacterium]
MLLLPLAAAAGPCGSVVIPTGIGLGDPDVPDGLNPLLATSSYTLQVAALLYRPLVWIGPTLHFDHDRSLAQAVEALDGDTRFRVTLKPWHWSDGGDVTADDVVFGFERIGKLGTLYPAAGTGGVPGRIADVRAVDAHTVDFVMKAVTQPDWFTLNGLSLIYALPRHAWGDIDGGTMWRRQNDPALYKVSDGPFVLTDFKRDRYAALAPNPDYGGHAASLARLVIVFPKGGNALHALEDGEIDMARVPYPLWDRMRHDRRFDAVILPEAYGYMVLMLNMKSAAAPFLRDVTVRRAMAQAIDQKGIIRLVFRGYGHENHAPAPAEPAGLEAPDAGAGLAHDPAAAAAALSEAGWVPGADGIRHRGAVRLAFAALGTDDPDGPEMQMLQIAQRNLRDVGIDMGLTAIPFAQKLERMYGDDANWDAGTLDETLPPFPDGMGTWNTRGNQNVESFGDPRLDALIRASVEQPGLDALFAYQRYAAQVQPGIFLPHGNQLILAAKRLHGIGEFANALGYWSPEYLSVDDPACRGAASGGALP